MLLRIVSFLVLVSLILGYSNRGAPVKALPAACSQYECVTVHAYWTGEKTYVWAVFDGNDNYASDAIRNIWAPSSNEQLPQNIQTESWNYYKYPTCSPKCKQLLDGKWPAWQEVTETGTEGAKSNWLRATCTAGGGTKTDPQKNNNTEGNTPPGN